MTKSIDLNSAMPLTNVTLLRQYKKEATIGKLLGNGIKIIETLERPKGNNESDDPKTTKNESSCIPEGTYTCKKYSSKKFPNTWEITGVESRTKILFHSANYISQLLGCVAVCKQIIDMNPKNDPTQDPTKRWYASQSKDAMEHFRKVIPKEFQLKITSDDSECKL